MKMNFIPIRRKNIYVMEMAITHFCPNVSYLTIAGAKPYVLYELPQVALCTVSIKVHDWAFHSPH